MLPFLAVQLFFGLLCGVGIDIPGLVYSIIPHFRGSVQAILTNIRSL